MVEQSLDEDYLARWIGNGETIEDVVSASQAEKLAATLDIKDMDLRTGAALPPFWHWIYFSTAAPASDLGPDGHPLTGDFYPPVALPRRMWAGGRIEFLAPLRIGDQAGRRSTIKNVTAKQGKSGNLVFVVVQHEVFGAEGLCIREEHDIVYRDAADPNAPPPPEQPAPDDAQWTRTINPDPVLLFRYSALTFNGHRIHYDLPYVTHDEGYPGLIVHGPLIATLLMDLCRRERPETPLATFSYRAMSPVFDIGPFSVNGTPNEDGSANLWATTNAGGLAMQAEATFQA